MKKTFAFILAVIMLVGLFTGVVAAEEKTEFLFIDGSDGYGMISFWTGAGTLVKDQTYTISYDALGVDGGKTMIDFGDGAVGGSFGVEGYNFTSTEWVHVSQEFTYGLDPANYNADQVANGVNGRIYTTAGNSFYIDNIVIKDSIGTVVMDWSDIIAPDGLDGWAKGSWGDGASMKAIVLPEAPEEPEEEPEIKEETENEVLGANELAGASFGAASDANNWWFRTDWNSSWKIEDGVLVAIGSGADNNGAFYNTKGEGQELSLTLKKGETYVVSMKVFRPAGVDSDSYLDINEGALASIHAEKNGEWETLTARFVANDKPIKLRLVVNALADGETVMFDDIELRMVGGDPNKTSSNPATSDNMVLGFVAVAMVVAVAGVAVVAKKRVLSK